jgi:hypothetical protein
MFDKKRPAQPGDVAGARLPSLDVRQPAREEREPPSQLLDCRSNGSPWDNETIAFLSTGAPLIVRVSYVERRFSAGEPPDGAAEDAYRISASGFLQCPVQHVHAQIDFSDRVEGYGLAFLTRTPARRVGGEIVTVPFLRIFLQKKDHVAQMGLVEAHRDALRSGVATSDFAIWHAPVPAGWFRRESESVYGKIQITGATSWCDLRSPEVEPWALPLEHEAYSLQDYPEPYRLRRLRL